MVNFLVVEDAGTHEVHCHMSVWYGKHCMCPTIVLELQKRFHEGCTLLQEDLHPGQAHRATTPDVIVQIDGLIRENRQITERN